MRGSGDAAAVGTPPISTHLPSPDALDTEKSLDPASCGNASNRGHEMKEPFAASVSYVDPSARENHGRNTEDTDHEGEATRSSSRPLITDLTHGEHLQRRDTNFTSHVSPNDPPSNGVRREEGACQQAFPSFKIPSFLLSQSQHHTPLIAGGGVGGGVNGVSGNNGNNSNGRAVVRSVTQKLVALAIDELNQADTRAKIKDHVISPLIKLIYSQMYPYLILAATVLLAGLVMWVLMFIMFTMSYFRK